MKAVNFRPVRRFSSAAVFAAVLVGIALSVCAPRGALAEQGDCGQPASTGSDPNAIDCLFMLGVAVGTQECGPEPCICDTSADGQVSATDGLICLTVAVGMIAQPACSCTGTTTTTVTTTTTTLVPGSCGSAELPLCDGVCGEGAACVVVTGGCGCRSYGCPVGAYTGGRCTGLCSGGAACVNGIDGCRCRSDVGPCESVGQLTCDGACSEGSYCTRDLVSGGCQCQAVACGEIADPPACYGVCPAGSVCAVSGTECVCVSGS